MLVISSLVKTTTPSRISGSLQLCLKNKTIQKKFFSSSKKNDENSINLKRNKKPHTPKESATDFKPRFSPFFYDGCTSTKEDLNFCHKAAMSTSAAPNLQSGAGYNKLVQDYMTVLSIIRNYQTYGHLVSKVDPLDMMFKDWNETLSQQLGSQPQRITRSHQLSNIDMNQVFRLPPSTYIGGQETELPLKEIIRRLELVYCRHIGAEFMYIENMNQVNWIRAQMETPGALALTPAEKGYLLLNIIKAAEFENFLSRKWQFERKFGLEGCEAMIPSMQQVIDTLAADGYDTFIIAMAHRGRLNVVANIIHRPLESLLSQFIGLKQADEGSGDVKYHLGTQAHLMHEPTKKEITIQLVANPSHLELASPIAVGMARAQQFYRGDTEGKKVMVFIMHGDASFCGQGVVFEVIHLSDLPEYRVHGVIHYVVNNKVGFTTDPVFSRASVYPTDVARVVNAPVFHVNADDPESVVAVSKIAGKYKSLFKKDVVIDLVCYRRRGHNEADEPMFTQPLLYKKIAKHPTVQDIYTNQLIAEGLTDKATVDQHRNAYIKECDAAFERAKKIKYLKLADWLCVRWSGFFEGRDQTKCEPTGISEEVLQHIGKVFSSEPPPEMKFEVHAGLKKHVLGKRKRLLDKRMIDWALGEAMAFGSLLKDKIHVRMSGQDVERGTFSHRHHVLHHQSVDKVTYNPLRHLYPDQAEYTVCNSSLSECGVMGFDHGYSMVNPRSLVIWEAQFGDFANGAQPLLDCIIAAGESKWVRQCGMVLQLPHGYEGMGAEHSSGRIERALQLGYDDPDVIPEDKPDAPILQLKQCNWIVANVSTPTNLFHILRRQILLPFRKPLVLFTPKSLLKHPNVISPLEEMLPGTQFLTVIPENGPASKNPDKVKKLILCSGKIYYDLVGEREKRKLQDVLAISRVEQLYPFPYGLIRKEVDKYKNAWLVWAQEEPKNQGPWYYVLIRMNTLLNGQRDIGYNGRAVECATATGSRARHLEEVKKLYNDTMNLENKNKK